MHLTKESKTLSNKLALILTLFLYYIKEPKTSSNKPIFTLFLYSIENKGSANKLFFTINTKLIAFIECQSTKLKKSISKD